MINCISCKKQKLNKIVKIGSQPLSGVFLNKKLRNEKKYPLDLYECGNCKLVQMKNLKKKDQMFGDTYEYKTSLSKLMTDHIYNKVKKINKKKYLKKNSKILDIGSNDGTFLNFFSKKQYDLYGIDPSAKKFKKNYNKKINLISKFFNKKNIEEKYHNIKFDLITSFAMFYDVDDPNKFCKEINELLTNDGIWILELSYMPLMLKNLTFDQICHEHIAYYSLSVFNNIVKKNKLKIIDISFNEINGGSIEIICTKKKNNKRIFKKKISKVLIDEKKILSKSYQNFNLRIEETKTLLQMFLNLKSKKKIIGYGASTKGNIVLNYCNVNNRQIKEICDGSIRKNGKYTPGTNIKIISKKKMRKQKPDYLLVLIWSFRTEVIKQEKNLIENGTKLVFLLPKFHIVNKDNYKKYLQEDFKKMSYKY